MCSCHYYYYMSTSIYLPIYIHHLRPFFLKSIKSIYLSIYLSLNLSIRCALLLLINWQCDHLPLLLLDIRSAMLERHKCAIYMFSATTLS